MIASRRRLERRDLAVGIALVARADVGQHIFVMRRHAAREQLAHAPLGADLRRGGDEQLHVGIGRDDRADVAAVEHRSARLAGEILLPLEQRRANRRISRHRRGDPRHRLAPQFRVVGVEPSSWQARSASNSLDGSPPQRHRLSATAR